MFNPASRCSEKYADEMRKAAWNVLAFHFHAGIQFPLGEKEAFQRFFN